jgi:hypothetical protein
VCSSDLILIFYVLIATYLAQETKKTAQKSDYDNIITLFEASTTRLFDFNNFNQLELKNKNGIEKQKFSELSEMQKYVYILEMSHIFNRKMFVMDKIWKNELSAAPEASPSEVTKADIQNYIEKLKSIRNKFNQKQKDMTLDYVQKFKDILSEAEQKVLMSQLDQYLTSDS